MATTTPNFGWSVPTSTDLVKDGATAIETLGDSIDASMAELKGGTTGQVLSKTSNTDMDFTWVAQDDSNAIQNSIVDAKGDIITATANDTPARLAVGANGLALIADSTAATGLKWAAAGGDTGPSFSAYRTTSTQSISPGTFTKAQLNAEDWDTASAFDSTTNYRFTPTTAGYYMVAVNGYVAYSAADCFVVYCYKNGSVWKYLAAADKPTGGGTTTYAGSCQVYLNGSTDYIEMYVYSFNATTAIPTGSSNTQFSAALVRTA